MVASSRPKSGEGAPAPAATAARRPPLSTGTPRGRGGGGAGRGLRGRGGGGRSNPNPKPPFNFNIRKKSKTSSHPGVAPTSAAASTSSKRDPEDEPASGSEESGDEEQDVSSGPESESDEFAERERKLECVLADVTFGELQRARADGSLAAQGASAAATAQKKARRESRKRPMEISTNVRPPRLREVIQVPKKVVRDPRFEPVYGAVDKEGFRKRYNFLFDHDLPAEKEKLQKSIKKLKDPNAIEEVKNQITWIDKQLRSNPQKNVESEILHGHIKKEREAAKAGKRPYYLKKSEIRERKLMDKYNELKEAGKLDAFMEKRRKKNASKDHRYMPYRRDGGGA